MMTSKTTENLVQNHYLSRDLSPRQRPPGRRVITYGTFDLLHEAHLAVFDSWEGPEAYTENLRRYCEVVFMPEELAYISSTALRGVVKMDVIGAASHIKDLLAGAAATGGVEIAALQTESQDLKDFVVRGRTEIVVCETIEQLYTSTEAVYISTELPSRQASIRHALQASKHVLCANPLSLSRAEAEECFELATAKGLVLLEAIPSAFTPAIERMTAVARNGKVGRVLS